MFFKLVFRNSVRSHKENALFMGSLVLSIIAFYVVLSLSSQDVMRYLQTLESDAIRKLFAMIVVLYGFTLFIIFALIYFASKYQIERRSHEFGVYIMMGMKRLKLLGMLLLEDVSSSAIALLIGLPVSVLLTELISLLTVKMVGIGFLGHQVTFNLEAVGYTTLGFLGVKLLAFIIHAVKLSFKEVGTLLQDAPDNVRMKKNSTLHVILLILGAGVLGSAYFLGIRGDAWEDAKTMGITVLLGLIGTILLFRGLRVVIDRIAHLGTSKKLHVFNFRQVEDTVIFKSGTLAICSILILVAVACLAAGLGTFSAYNMYDTKRVDYTFADLNEGKDQMTYVKDAGIEDRFAFLDTLKLGHPYVVGHENYESAFDGDEFNRIYREKYEMVDPHYRGAGIDGFPFMIRYSDYCKLIEAMGYEPYVLQEGEIGLYRSETFAGNETEDNEILSQRPHVKLVDKDFVMAGKMQQAPIVTDRYITLAGALIVPDADFDRFVDGREETYLNGILDRTKYAKEDQVQVYTEINEKLNTYPIEYESYLQNMGRQLFYLVAASYITLYLAMIFLIVANTILAVQFLMGQKRSSRRYRTLVKLGADHKTLYKSSKKQINWYFGIPIAVACASAYFATRALFNGILSSRTKVSMSTMIPVVLIVIVMFCLIEYVYMFLVKRSSSRFLETLMTPEREE